MVTSNLRWAEINFEMEMISFLDTKAKKRRDVSMGTKLAAYLKTLPRTGPWVLMHEGKRLGEMRTLFRAACKKAGIREGVRWHDLRHTHATLSVMANTDLRTLQHRLGHSSLAVTERYAHVGSEQERKAADAVVLGLPRE